MTRQDSEVTYGKSGVEFSSTASKSRMDKHDALIHHSEPFIGP